MGNERYLLGGILCFIVVLSMFECEDNDTSHFSSLTTHIEYQSPVDYDIQLAGNFGEPRPWHFHGGIDVKTGNVEGKQIFSIAMATSVV